MTEQKWFLFEKAKISLDLSQINEIHWEATNGLSPGQNCTALYSGTSGGVTSTEFLVFDANDRIALRKFIVGDDWQPPEVVVENLINSLGL